MKILATNIRWDTDGEYQDELDLPTSAELDVPDDIDPTYELADILSDEYGFCVEGFSWMKLP